MSALRCLFVLAVVLWLGVAASGCNTNGGIPANLGPNPGGTPTPSPSPTPTHKPSSVRIHNAAHHLSTDRR